MDPTTVFCPNLAGPARGQAGQRNIRIQARRDRRFLCMEGHKTFTAPKGTAFHRLRPSAETVTLVVTLMAHGCPRQAIVVACGLDERTVARWLGRAGGQGQAVPQHLVEQPRDLGEVQADEIRVKQQGGMGGMALARMVSSRLWLAGEVSEHRDLPLIRRLITRVYCMCLYTLHLVLYRRLVFRRTRRARDLPRGALEWQARPSSAPHVAQGPHRASRQAVREAARGGSRAPHRAGGSCAGGEDSVPLPRRWGDQHRFSRAPQGDVS